MYYHLKYDAIFNPNNIYVKNTLDYLLVECLFAAKDYQEALNLLNSLEIEDLNASLINKDETEQDFYRETSEPNKNVSKQNNYSE